MVPHDPSADDSNQNQTDTEAGKGSPGKDGKKYQTPQALTLELLVLKLLQALDKTQGKDRMQARELKSLRDEVQELLRLCKNKDPHDLSGVVGDDGSVSGSIGGVPFRIGGDCDITVGKTAEETPPTA